MKKRIFLTIVLVLALSTFLSCGDEDKASSSSNDSFDAWAYYPLETGASWTWSYQENENITHYLSTTVSGTWTLDQTEGYALVDSIWNSDRPWNVAVYEHYQNLTGDTLLYNDPRVWTCGNYEGWLLKHIINPNRVGDHVPSLDYTEEQEHFGYYRWRIVSGDTSTVANGITYANCIMIRNEFERLQVDAEHPAAVYPLQDRYFVEGVGLVRFENYTLDYDGSPSEQPYDSWELVAN